MPLLLSIRLWVEKDPVAVSSKSRTNLSKTKAKAAVDPVTVMHFFCLKIQQRIYTFLSFQFDMLFYPAESVKFINTMLQKTTKTILDNFDFRN